MTTQENQSTPPSGEANGAATDSTPPPANYPVLTGFPAQKRLDTSNIVVYQVWLNYYAKNPSDGQNSDNVFANVSTHFAELAKMGVTMIQLSPVHPFADDTTVGVPYSIKDYYDINPGYAPGDRNARVQAFKDMVSAAHQNGLKVIMDCVYHSTDAANVLMKTNPNDYVRTAGQVEKNRYGFSVLDYANQAVTTYMVNMTKYWETTVGVDGCRADVAVMVPLSFWAKLNNEMKKLKPDWFQVAETGQQWPLVMGPYSGPGFDPGETYENVYGFDAMYGIKYMDTMRAILDEKVAPAKIWQDWDPTTLDQLLPEGNTVYLTVDNHDQHPRAAALAQGNAGMVAASIFNMTFKGIPFIFDGQEIGDTAPTSIRSQKFISWRQPPHPENASIFQSVLAIRKQHPALNSGSVAILRTDQASSVLSFIRQSGTDKVLVAVNLSRSPWSGAINGGAGQLSGRLTDLLTDQPLASQPSNNQLQLSLPADGYVIASMQ